MLVSVNWLMRRVRALGAVFGLVIAVPSHAGRREETKETAPVIRPVRTVTVEHCELGESIRLAGHILVATVLTLIFLRARYVASFRVKDPKTSSVAMQPVLTGPCTSSAKNEV